MLVAHFEHKIKLEFIILDDIYYMRNKKIKFLSREGTSRYTNYINIEYNQYSFLL
jgi:hypothetical protein